MPPSQVPNAAAPAGNANKEYHERQSTDQIKIHIRDEPVESMALLKCHTWPTYIQHTSPAGPPQWGRARHSTDNAQRMKARQTNATKIKMSMWASAKTRAHASVGAKTSPNQQHFP